MPASVNPISETALLSEKALSGWGRPEEEAAPFLSQAVCR